MTDRSTFLPNLWKSLRPYIRHNLGLKLLAFVASLALYIYVHGSQNAQRIMAVDVVAMLPNADQHLALTTDLPTSVRVTLHGPRSRVTDLRSEDLGSFSLNLRAARDGRVQLDPNVLHVPGGVVVDSVDPPSVDVAWDELTARDVPIQVTVAGEPIDGFVVKSQPSFNPIAVTARGPKEAVDALRSVRAEPYDVSGIGEGRHTRSLNLDRPPARVQYSESSVSATVEITRKLAERVFSKVHVEVVGAPKGAPIPATVDVRVVGAPDLVQSLRIDQIIPRVTLTESAANFAKPGSIALPVILELDNVQLSIVPKSVIVRW